MKSIYKILFVFCSLILFVTTANCQSTSKSNSTLPYGWKFIQEQDVNQEIRNSLAGFRLKEPQHTFNLVRLKSGSKQWANGNKYWSLGDTYAYNTMTIGIARFHKNGDSPAHGLKYLQTFTYDEDNNVDIVFTLVDEQPSPQDGMASFYQYIRENLKYPQTAIENRVEGKVYVQFIVGKDGNIENARVIHGLGGECDEEAVRVVQQSPQWNPGKNNGQPVKVRMILPITYKL
jgi:TonB family protein